MADDIFNVKPDKPGAMAERLRARRSEKLGGGGQDGEGCGNLGQQIAREPLFVGLGIRGHHNAGQLDTEAPKVGNGDVPGGFEDLGAPDPQPVRKQRMRM
jgi:hypothetical protein